MMNLKNSLLTLALGLGVSLCAESTRTVDVLVVGGTTKGVTAALAAKAAGKSVYLVTPYAYLGEDLAGTLELGYDRTPTTDLEKKLWQSVDRQASFEYYFDHPTPAVRWSFRNDALNRLSDPNDPSMMDHAVLYIDPVTYRCVMKRPSKVAKVSVLVLETDGLRRDDIFSKADQKRLAQERPGVTKVATGAVTLTFKDGARAGETITLTRRGKVFDLAAGDSYPAGAAVLYEGAVDSEISEVSLRISPDPAAHHHLVSRLRFVLAGDACCQEPPTPLKVKQVYDRALLDADVDFLTSTAVRRVLRKKGRLTGVETVNRSGREIVRAKKVVDATLYGLLGKVPAVGAEETFSRVVISNDRVPSFPGMTVEEIPAELVNPRFSFKGRMFRCSMTLPMTDGAYPSFAAAEWESWARVATPLMTDVSDLLLWRPSATAIAQAREAPDELPVWGEFDVVVVGGGTAGASAAVAAARGGAKTLVVEYRDMLGGVGTDGMVVGFFDGNRRGFSEELTALTAKEKGIGHYTRAEAWRKMCRDVGVKVWFGAMGLGTIREGNKVVGVEVSTPLGTGVVRAKCVIDGTGNSDIAAAAGAETEFVSADEIAVQSAGQSPQRLGRGSVNSDFGYLNDADARDVWLFMLRARAGAPEAWDIAKLPDSRERRRIVPDLRVLGEDVVARRTYPDTLVQALSRQDPHGLLTDDFGYLAEESAELVPGKVQDRWMFRVSVPLRCTLPKGLSGLSVIGLGAGIARDVVAISRMQADLMNMGYSVGLAAAMAAAKDGEFRSVDLKELRRQIVAKDILPKEALDWNADMDVSSDAVIAAAVRTLPDGYRGGHVIYRPENRARALPLLCAAYQQATASQARQTYALALGLLGDATGVPTLVACLTGEETLCVVRETPRKFGKAYTGGQVRNGMLLALGRTRDARAVKPLLAELEKVGPNTDFESCRTLLLALEALGSPKAAQPIAHVLKMPGLRGHAVKKVTALRPTGGYGPGPEYDDCLREMAFARALLASGDFMKLGRSVYEEYAQDVRGLLSAHAKAVLAKYAKESAGTTGSAPIRRAARVPRIDGPDVYCGEELYKPAELARKRQAPPPNCTDETRHQAAVTGKRKAYQPAFFELCGRLILFAAASQDDPSCVPLAEASLRQACAMTTWLLPNYGAPEAPVVENFIDLGSSAMAHAVASAVCLLGDRLDPAVRCLAMQRLEERVFGIFEKACTEKESDHWKKNWWIRGQNNWNAVCHAGVVRAALAVLADKERRDFYLSAAQRAAPLFLSGFLEDGYCTEGSGYWDYGYGHFLDLAKAVSGATGGKVDLTKLPRAREAFLYGAECRLTANLSPAFSDGGGRVGEQTLRKGLAVFPDLASSVNGNLPARTFFPCAQVYIGREKSVSFAIKGGNNDEFHNHNDVGSWMLACNGVEMVGEGGREIYGKTTFTPRRYEAPMLNSYGHPVPVIDGQLQGTGKAFAAKIVSQNFTEVADELVLDLTAAYANLQKGQGDSLIRTMRFCRGDKTQITVSDAATFTRPMPFESAVVTQGEIARLIDGQSVRITRSGQAVIVRVDAQGGGRWHLEEKPVANNENLPITRLALVFEAPIANATVTWTITEENLDLVGPTPLQPPPAVVVAGPTNDALGRPSVSLQLERRGCTAYLIAVNGTSEPLKASVDFGYLADWTTGEVLRENRQVSLVDRKLVDDFAPFAVHVYRFVRADVCYTGHQGEEALAPNHSRAAYRLAVEHGLDFIKLDIRRTKDNRLVLQHDDTLKAIYKVDVAIRDKTLAELEAFTAHPRGGFDQERICTLEDALVYCKKLKRGPWIDFKDFSPDIVEQTLALCAAAGFTEEQLLVGTWNIKALAYLLEKHPNVKRVQHTFIRRQPEGGYTTNVSEVSPGQKPPVFADEAALIAELQRHRDALKLYGFNLPHIVRRGKTIYHTSEGVVRSLKSAGIWISIWFPEDELTGDLYRGFGADNFVTSYAARTRRGFMAEEKLAAKVQSGQIRLSW